MEFLLPAGWPRPRGYSCGVADKGRMVFVSGMIGWDAAGKLVGADFASQARQALKNIVDVLAEANAKPEHIVRLTWYVLDKKEYAGAYKELGAAYREVIGPHYPAMSAVQVSALIEDGARVEIEATAVISE
jgi:enamine deaminase RidA (YjgF/YER057c/UK114 family)